VQQPQSHAVQERDTSLCGDKAASSRRDVLSGMAALGLSMRAVPLAAISKAQAAIPARPIAERMRQIVVAYPSFLRDSEPGFLVWKDGTRMPWSVKLPRRSYDEMLNNADLRAQTALPYPAGLWPARLAREDPGRFRYAPFFRKMYGGTKEKVEDNLKLVVWAPSGDLLRTSSVNGVDKVLSQIGTELAALPRTVHRFFDDPEETFRWRPILDTQRPSMHSFGIAIDLNGAYKNYWADRPRGGWQNRMPREVVEIFERHKFIWGGRWRHYDVTHFEYRPELF